MSLPESPKSRGGDNGGGGGGGGGIFVKLRDRGTIRGVFRGQPRFFYEHFLERTNRSVECEDEAACEHCKAGDRAKFKFAMNFITTEGGVLVAKIFKQSNAVYEQLLSLAKSGYNIPRTTLDISRTGSKADTRYTFIPVPGATLNDATDAIISKIPLNDLEPKRRAGAAGGGQAAAGSGAGSDAIPF